MSIAPSLKYLEKTNFKFDNSTYINRDSQFDGCIIFKDLEGKLVNGWIYSDGKIKSSMKPASSNIPSTKATNTWCQTIYTWEISYNGGGYIFNITSELTYCWEVNDCEEEIGGGGGGGPYAPPPTTFSLEITPLGYGTVSGRGVYLQDSTVTVQATPNMGYKLDKWTGDFASYGNITGFSFQITRDMTATAIFVRIKPCRDNISSDPLMSMNILGSKYNGIAGGRFGNARGTPHNGIDLDATIGTLIYAMFDGYADVVTYFIQGMNYEDYDNIYGIQNRSYYNAGNRVRITSIVDGQTIKLKYFHLDQVFVQTGDYVTAGTLIGTVGTTGSACSPESNGPHLHLEAWKNNDPINAEPYLFTKFAPDGSKTRNCN